MALSSVVDEFVTMLGGMSGIVKCYSDPPESISQFPAAFVYVQSGSIDVGSHGAQSEHILIVEIHHERSMVDLAVDAAKVWPERLTYELYTHFNADRFGGYVTAIVWPVTYEALASTYGSGIHYMMRFRIPIKIITNPATSV